MFNTCLDAEGNTGLDFNGRLFISDRDHVVFDFQEIVDLNSKGSRVGGCSSLRVTGGY